MENISLSLKEITIKMEKRKKYIPLMIKKQWASKPSTSPKEKLEFGKVLKEEIGESG